MANYSWTCPYCERPVTIRESTDVESASIRLNDDNVEGMRFLISKFVICPNPDCKKFTLIIELYDAYVAGGSFYRKNLLNTWQLVPNSKSKTFPDYIPKAVLQDYVEACLIKDDSPKASATLSRRCLQGIIRDFWQGKVKPGKLAKEIEQLKEVIDTTVWQAIDAVRSIGNIGAHMEEDVNLIVDIEPQEAELLINLIETLLKDWYIAQHDRQAQLQAIVELGKQKKGERKTKLAEAES